MAHPSRTPAFLQPNTVLSSRAAIFNEDFGHNHTTQDGSGMSRTDQDHEEESEESDDNMSKALLKRLYGQLQGSIQVQVQSTFMDTDSLDEDQSVKSNVGQGDQDSEMEAMEFRLFSSQDTPATILLNTKELETVHVHYDRPELDESPGSLRMHHISEAAIDAATILEQAQVPWPRTFFAHKVINVPFKQKVEKKMSKKSKRKREWEKRMKAGLIDQATIDATARKIKVSESWGEPVLMRKGLDKNVFGRGATRRRGNSSRDYRGRGSGRGERGGRGGRGGRASTTYGESRTIKGTGPDRKEDSKDRDRTVAATKANSHSTSGSAPVVAKAKLDGIMAILTNK
ncbi:MAG: hypothetical protein J3Q66DRAFT_328074 [Benniella sp.]|nr:MAG: hypothetical protein J3Q66DRAFT_328074 [Benniella sp.]